MKTVCMSCVPLVIQELEDDEQAPPVPFVEDPRGKYENAMARGDANIPTLVATSAARGSAGEAPFPDNQPHLDTGGS